MAGAAGLHRWWHDSDRFRVRVYHLSGDKQPFIAPIIGLVATLAPTIGPTVGGYLTDWFSWHWLFLVNLGPASSSPSPPGY